jgi:hypothetical protein
VFPFNLLRVCFANGMLFRRSVALIYFCPIGVLDKYVILSGSADIGQHHPASVIEGMPSPALLSFVADHTPQVINFCGCHCVDEDAHVRWIPVMQDRMIAILEVRCLFLNVSRTVV